MFKGSVRKEHFHGSTNNWLMNVLGFGPGIGDVFYVCTDGGTYHAWLADDLKVPDDNIFHTVALAYAATTSNRNDVVCKYPGIETVTAELNWSNSRTHLVGLGGPQQKGYESGTGLTSSTITVANVIHNTGVNNQFHNITVMNAGGNAACLSAFKNAGYGTRMIGCQIIGCAETATQGKTALANSLAIASGGYYFYAENCNFGSTDFGALGADTACVLLFEADGMSSDGKFVACNFGAMIDATTRPLIYVGSNGIDRDWIFDRCEFYAFSTNHTYKMAQVVTNQDAVPSTYDMVFKDCCAINVTAFRTASNGCTWASGGGAAASKTGVAIITT
jgi:hypothetical protein